MTRRLSLRRAELDVLASDADDAAAVRILRLSQHSRRLLLLRAVLDRAAGACPRAYRSARAEEAFGLLARTQEIAPSVVEDVLLHPPVGGWAATSLRTMSEASVPTDSVATDLRHLGAIAASAALQAGQTFEVTVPVHGRRVVVPMLGSAELPMTPQTRPAVATVRHSQASTTISCGPTEVVLPADLSREAPGWHALPRLSAQANGQRLAVVLDDADAYRDYPGLSPATQLPRAAVARWNARFEEAWALLTEHHPRLANSIAAGLCTLVPLDRTGSANVSGTSSDAFGAAAVSLPETGVDLAVTMVHEVQHSKLGALLDLVPLCQGRTRAFFYAPWRDDPRPIGGLLHGCYAYFGITQFWRVQRQVAVGQEASVAHFEFARWREETWRTCLLLSRSGVLTAPGRRFVAGMRYSLARCRAEHVPSEPSSAARLAALDHRISWRLRNLRPAEAVIADLGRAWRAGRPCPIAGPVPSDVLPGSFSPSESARTNLLRCSLRHPQLFGLLAANPVAVTAVTDGAQPADASLVSGNYSSAVQGYRAELSGAGSTPLGAWSGWILARSAGGEAVGGALRRCPEVVVALHREVLATSGVAPDPEDLARWLVPVAGQAR